MKDAPADLERRAKLAGLDRVERNNGRLPGRAQRYLDQLDRAAFLRRHAKLGRKRLNA